MRLYNPRGYGECGYACVLKCAGLAPTKSRLAWLTKETATAFHQAHDDMRTVAGVTTRELLALEGVDLQSYKHMISSKQWASQVEVQLACEVLDLSSYIFLPAEVHKVGDNPKNAIKYHMQYWTLDRVRGKVAPTAKHHVLHRGGMEAPPIWRQVGENRETGLIVEIVEINHTHRNERPRRVFVQVHPEFMGNYIDQATFNMTGATPSIRNLRVMLGRLLGRRPIDLQILDEKGVAYARLD